jgi:hypothetical protein
MGAIAQLGERIVRNDEVVGSIPTSSTNLLKDLRAFSPLIGHRQTQLIWNVLERELERRSISELSCSVLREKSRSMAAVCSSAGTVSPLANAES